MHAKTSKNTVNFEQGVQTEARQTGRDAGVARVRLSLMYIPPVIFQAFPGKKLRFFDLPAGKGLIER